MGHSDREMAAWLSSASCTPFSFVGASQSPSMAPASLPGLMA